METQERKYAWWQDGIIYQVYVRSFQDSNGDGVGDLLGIIQRLDYLKWLGINIIWLTPVYPSPMKDFGYDISDYKNIYPLFGSLEDFDALLREAHKRGIKIIMDLVPNHTSNEHPWFIESRSSRDNPKRNWYIWHDPKPDGSPPNNWLAMFGGSAWEWDEHTGQYYYHGFLKEQPDLNYREPEVLDAMLEIMRYWLERGIDGFRVDVMWHMMKDKQLRDNPANPDYNDQMPDYNRLLPVFSTDQPEVHDIVCKMRKTLDEYADRMMIGEIYLPIHKLISYYGTGNNGANLPYNFLLISAPWDAIKLAATISEYEGALPESAWPNWVLGNHDQPRVRSRIGYEQARNAAMLLLTLRGTPTIYYGDEIGMQDVAIPSGEIQDPQGLNMPEKDLSRDPARTPMQWDDSVQAGFTTGRPWLRIDRAYKRENVVAEQADTYSMLYLYKRLIELRQSEPALKTGNYKLIVANAQGFIYIRESDNGNDDSFLVALNLTHRPCHFTTDKPYAGTIILSTAPELEGLHISGPIYLGGDEGIIIRLTKDIS